MSEAFVTREKWDAVRREMERLGVKEAELIEKFVRGSGPGGQKINKTSSCVYLHHPATGIEIKCQRSRSREVNRVLARRELCERVAERIRGEIGRKRAEAERIRRQKRRRSRKQKQRVVAEKRARGETKAKRQAWTGVED